MNRMSQFPILKLPGLPGLPGLSGLPISDPMANNVKNIKVNPVSNTLSLSPIVEQSQTNSLIAQLQYPSPLSTYASPMCLTPYPSYLHSEPIAGSSIPPLNLLQLSDVNS
eukprot:UN01709